MSAMGGLVGISYDYETAGRVTGLSKDVIEKAVTAGELERHYVSIADKQVRKPVVMHDDLRAWVERGRSEYRP